MKTSLASTRLRMPGAIQTLFKLQWRGLWSAALWVLLSVFCEASLAQSLISRGNICWQSRANYDRVIVHFEPYGNSDWDTNMTVNGVTIGSTGHGSGYAGQSGYVDGKTVYLGYVKVGGCSKFFCASYNARIDESQCKPTFEDTGVSPNEGHFWLEAFDFVKPVLTVSKTATPSRLQAGGTATYTITVSVTQTATTAPLYISDSLPAGITTSGAITASGGTVYGCPGAGASSLNGCYIPTGFQGTLFIQVPVNVDIGTASYVVNTATASGGGVDCAAAGNSCSGSTGNPVDPANPKIVFNKALSGSGRVVANDQFKVSIKTGGVNGSEVNSASNSTTSGSDSSVDPGTGTTGIYTGTANTTYTLTETGINGANLARYSGTITCSDSAGRQSGMPFSGQAYDPNVGLAITPVAGANISCTLTNSPKAPVLTLSKAMDAAGRVGANDQFKVAIKTGGVNGSEVSNPSNSTTAGSGNTVDPGTGTTGAYTATAGTTYTLTEAAAGSTVLQRYSSTIACSDSAGVQPGLPFSGQAYDPNAGLAITPVAGANISCTITNGPKAPLLKLQKRLGGAGRIHPDDQFFLAIYASTGQQVANATTSGNGSNVSGQAQATGTRGERYMVGESMAGQSVSNVEQYSYPVSCTNALSVAQGGLDVSGVTSQGSLFGPVGAGDDITCAITNTPKVARLTIRQVVLPGSGTGPFNFNYTVNNGWGSAQISSPNTSTPGQSETRVLGATNTNTDIGVSLPPGWQINPGGMSCVDNNGAVTGNAGTLFGTPTATGITVPATHVRPASDLVCTVSLGLAAPVLTLNKTIAGRIKPDDQFTVQIKNGNTVVRSATTINPDPMASTGPTALTAGTAHTLSEVVANPTTFMAQYNSSLSCSNANTGSTTPLPSALDAAFTPQMGDVITCTIANTPKPPSFKVLKALGGSGRVHPADQFQVQLIASGGGPVATANTSGTGTDTGNAVATYTPTVGSKYLYGEILLPGSVSSFAQYIGTGACVNTLPTAQGGSNVNIGMGYDIGPIQYGDDITCTITNTPKAPALSLSKALGGTGRVGSDDQFTLAIKTGGLHGTVVAQTTTAGAGTLVSNGSASLGSAALATAYTLTEAGSNGSNLKRYSSTLSCTDSAGVQKTGLPSGQAFDPSVGYTLTPEAGANIVCTLTNSPRAPQIRVTKALGGPRISDDDQFVVAIYQAPGGGLLASTTTTGTRSTVRSATLTATRQIGMRYMVGESMRAGSPSNIEQYRYPLSCTNTLSTAEGGTDVSMVGLGQLFGLPNNPTDLVAGDDIACVLTNIPKSASLSLSKALSSTGRVNAGDQFTLKIKTGGVNGTDLASATTSGLGTSASGSASLNPASPGTTYTLTEAPANGAVLAQYTATIRCVDSAGFQTGLPEGAPFDPNQGLNIAPVHGANIACTLSNTAIASLTITGKVFLDVGAGSGLANDGVLNGTESPLAGVRVQLSNCSGIVYAQTLTDGQGQYSLKVPNVATGAPLCVTQTNPMGHTSTGASVGSSALPSGTPVSVAGTSYTYQRSSDQIAFSWNGLGHSDLNFGDVPPSTWVPNGSKTAAPGSTVTYAHTFTAGTAGTVVFSVSSTATPSLAGWSERIFADPACTGSLQPGAVQLYPPLDTGTPVSAQQKVCVVVQQFVPATAPVGHKNVATVQASLNFANANPALSASYTVTDTTLVDTAALNLLKEVRNVTQSGSFGANNQARSGDVLEYRITYTNTMPSPLSNLNIHDTTPAFTSFLSSTLGDTPATLTACLKTTPASPTVPVACNSSQSPGGTGAVIWRFTGSLPGSGSGQVLFQGRVD